MRSDENKTRADLAKELAGLRQRIAEFETSQTKQKRVEEVFQNRTHALAMRVKELNCLFGISKLVERRNISWEDIFQRVVNLIPPAWQHSEITRARVIVAGQGMDGAEVEVFAARFWMAQTPCVGAGPGVGDHRQRVDGLARFQGELHVVPGVVVQL